jgi:hypothetical protein
MLYSFLDSKKALDTTRFLVFDSNNIVSTSETGLSFGQREA